MIIFSSGIVLTANENSALLHMVPDAEAWVSSTIAEKSRLRRDALIEEWRPRLYADDSVTELPANPDDLATLILARSDYKTRAQQDATADPVVSISTDHKDKYDAVTRSGSTVTLFSSGITIPDLSANCILAYVQNLEEWVIGAVLGMINRGKKKMIAQYHPIIMADSSVTTMPATEDGLITMILARDDYQRLGGN
tara:strand:- start:185 stop:772 length:588 start_codon:yes stop_codon:yes gene_type:complete